MSGIWWLASYPKSGNTWLRALLTNYLGNTPQPADINDLLGRAVVFSRSFFDDVLGFDSADLRPSELERYQPLVHSELAARGPHPLFVKNHSAFVRNAEGEPLFPPAATAGAIYAIRNPLDVAVSMAHHQGESVDQAIRRMARPDAALARPSDRLYPLLPQKLSSWSGHVTSWVDEPGLARLVVRYEDMLQHGMRTLGEVVDFLGLPRDEGRLRRALEFSRFEMLQAQEAARGFTEKNPAAPTFFREGRAGSWRRALTEPQRQRIIADHGAVMARFGYREE